MKRDAGEVENFDDDDEDLVNPCARCIIIIIIIILSWTRTWMTTMKTLYILAPGAS
jgi:hypothetical protein